MPAVIRFIGGLDHTVEVDEDVEGVKDAILASEGSTPVPLTKQGDRIYVTPANIAYWEAK